MFPGGRWRTPTRIHQEIHRRTAVSETARRLARSLVDVAGDGIRAILLYGSHLLGAAPDRHSAYDLVVVVEGYREIYGALRASGFGHRSPWLMSAMARVLPPNVIAYTPEGEAGPIAKGLVVSAHHFERETSAAAKDLFMIVRMMQQVDVLYVRDDAAEVWTAGCLASARGTVVDWAAPYVTTPFTAESLARGMLEISYRGEIRPESTSRARSIFEAQRPFLIETYEAVLRDAARAGRLVEEAGGYRLASPPGRLARARRSAYLAWSRVRVTARWLKHVVTFENWLPYVVRKVKRRAGVHVELSPLERRLPLLFLWPRVFRVLRRRPTDEAPPSPTARSDEEDA